MSTQGAARPQTEAPTFRELDLSDLVPTSAPAFARPQLVAKIRQSHHRIAFMLAQGEREAAVAAALGYSISRISILKNDPMFQELLAFYAGQAQAERLRTLETLQIVALEAVQEMQDRLHQGDLSNGEILELMKLALDRSGHGPASKIISTGISLTGEDLRAIKEESTASNVRTITVAATDITADVGEVLSSPTVAKAEAQGTPREGPDLRANSRAVA